MLRVLGSVTVLLAAVGLATGVLGAGTAAASEQPDVVAQAKLWDVAIGNLDHVKGYGRVADFFNGELLEALDTRADGRKVRVDARWDGAIRARVSDRAGRGSNTRLIQFPENRGQVRICLVGDRTVCGGWVVPNINK